MRITNCNSSAALMRPRAFYIIAIKQYIREILQYGMDSAEFMAQTRRLCLNETGDIVKNFFTRLNNMLTAIAYAEAGDLDAVKQILQATGKDSPAPEDRESGKISDDHAELPAF